MSANRRLVVKPKSLAEHVLELDAQIPSGPGDVELPAGVWSQLCARAELACDEAAAPAKANEFGKGIQLVRVEAITDTDSNLFGTVRVLVGDDGVILSIADARELSKRLLQRADDAWAASAVDPAPAPKKKRQRKARAFCAVCGETTPHDGNDACTRCAAPRAERAEREAVDQANDFKAPEPHGEELPF